MTDFRDETEESQPGSFFGSILEPGSSFDPTFLLVVDGAFASLLVVLVAFAVLTRGNIHLVFLTFIELALWASVKWYVASRPDSRWWSADADILGSYTSGTWCKATISRLQATSSQKKIEKASPADITHEVRTKIHSSPPSFVTGLVPSFRSFRAFLH